MARTPIIVIAGLLAALICSSAVATVAAPKKAYLQNPSFESVAPLKAPPKGSERGQWVLKSNLLAPAQWTLSGAFPGTLEVVEGGAADGKRFLRLAAGPERAAHLVQPCPDLRRGLGYEISLRYRGGPVDLKVYEYDGSGKLKADRALTRAWPTPVRNGAWEKLVAIYMVPNGIEKVHLSLAVPAGCEADLDDLQISTFQRSAKRLNVRDFGASGSEFETTADTTAGSNVITLKEIGDFKTGQQVAVSKCSPRVCDLRLWEITTKAGNAYGGRFGPVEEQILVRGYDGSTGNWNVYLLDCAGGKSPTFRWSDDVGLTWKDIKLTVGGDWQKLNGGVEVKLGKRDWTTPCLFSFSGRDQLISTIMKIEGTAMTLSDPAPVGTKACVVQHTDSGPLQYAFNRAVAEGRNVIIPSGCYRLTSGLRLNGADGITVEGENEENTILDITGGQGTCISIVGGTSITIRNLRFRGFSSFAERKQMGFMRTNGYLRMWGFYVKHCNAVGIRSPERVLVENCHAMGMSAECFYSGSSSRRGNDQRKRYTKSIVYRHCTVTDCARNAFNNNDHAENTAVLYCRIEDVGGCSWEGASRFVKIVGNYVRNAGTIAMGNIRSRDANLDILPSGQHIVAHNTFEEQMVYGACAIRSSAGSTPVLISNNIFINFNTSAIEATGFGDYRNLPGGNTIITGNAIDLTCVRDESKKRFGIHVSADDATISDNQIYIRGEVDPLVKGIVLTQPARNIVAHDNIIRGCAIGLEAERTVGRIDEVIDPRTFKSGGRLPWPRRGTHCYRGYRIAWLQPGKPAFVLGPTIKTFDADEGLFRLSGDCDLKKGATFTILSPQGLAWNIHDNVINNCAQLVNLDVFGGPTAAFTNNLLSRGETGGVKVAMEIHGLFKIAGNQFCGFNEPDSVALMLHPDAFGKPLRLLCRDNVFTGCATPIAERTAGLWKACHATGNLHCATLDGPLQPLKDASKAKQ